MTQKSQYINFPFTAFTAMENAQLALLLGSISPQINGVLLSGTKGTGKSTLIRALQNIIPDKKFITLPISVNETALFGGVDIEQTLTKGMPIYQQGIFAKAHNQIIYIDEVNLLSDSVLKTILGVLERGVYTVYREGEAKHYPCSFTLLATMNPEEGGLPTSTLDRFHLFVANETNTKDVHRVEMLRQHRAYSKNPTEFCSQYAEEEKRLRKEIGEAKELLTNFKVTDADLQVICQMCKEAFVAGHRADIFLLWAAMANASYKGEMRLSMKTIQEVKDLVLSHRVQSPKQAPKSEPDNPQKSEDNQSQTNDDKITENDTNTEEASEDILPQSPNENTSENESSVRDQEEWFDIAELSLNTDILRTTKPQFEQRKGIGKRIKCKKTQGVGRHIRSRLLKANDSISDIDFLATLRAAAPFQKSRKRIDIAVDIRLTDLHKKVKEHRTGNSILFVVDASGSMGIQQRMSEAKAGVLSLLKDAYVKRDTVGLMTFRADEAHLVLPFTRSVERAYKLLKELKTGGRTPLFLALQRALEIFIGVQTKNLENLPLLVLFTDGKATATNKSENGLDKIENVARKFALLKIRCILIDTESGFVRLGYGRKISEWLGAEYYHIDQLKEKELKDIINK